MQVFNWVLPTLLLVQGVLSESSYGKYINTACTAASDCGLNTHLQCISNYCQCDSLTQIYDQSTQKCLLLLGQECQIWSGSTSEKHHHQIPPIKCVPHADCTKSVCRCRTGYRSSEEFLCKPDYGTACHAQDDCDDTLGLVCGPQGICQCFNSTWIYQGHFGCVDPTNPQYNEMLRLLNQTEQLLKENNLELKDMFNDLGLQNDPDTADFTINNVLAMSRQFQDTYNTNDLQFAAQNQNSQQAGGLNLPQLLGLFSTFQNLFPRFNGGGGGGGFLRNLFRGGNNQGGGYADSSTTPPTYGPPSAGGYQASGQPEGMGQRMGLLNSFLNLFNQMIPIVRQLRMRFSPIRFFQNLINRFAPTTAAPPAPAAIHNAPPTIIASNGNYQTNPIFDNNPGQEQSQGNTQGQGSFRFFMRSRERFRNFLRGNRPGGGGGGYDYTPANPPDKYGPPGKGYGPPAAAPPPAADEGAPPPAADAPAGSNQQNFFTNNPRASFHGQSNGQAQYSTVHVTTGGLDQQHEQIPQSAAPAPAQRQQSFSNGAFNSGQHPNPQSFFGGQQPTNHQNNQQFSNNNANQQQTNFNNQAHQQANFVPQQPSNNHANHHAPPSSNIFDSSSNSFVRPPVVPSITASPTSQFKLPVHPPKVPASEHESLSQNFILSEADDPHPGFTPLSTPSPQGHQQQDSFRTSARFERIAHVEQPNSNTAAQNWRESF